MVSWKRVNATEGGGERFLAAEVTRAYFIKNLLENYLNFSVMLPHLKDLKLRQ